MERRTVALLSVLYLLALACALGILAWGIYLAAARREFILLAAGSLAVILGLLAAALLVQGGTGRDRAADRLESLLAPVNERLQQISVLLNQVSEQQLISERAKAIAFRDSERDALRRAIHEEIARKDWDAALTLAGQMENLFGYRKEADQFRREIQAQRDGEYRRQLDEGIALIDRHCRGEQWDLATREAERLIRLFPDDLPVQRLPQDIENRRQAHKRSLIESWNEAVARHDVDGSIEILRSLDGYLTPQEAQAMQEPARQMFKDKRFQMGQQFAMAVKEHRWSQAIRIGEAIANEFPNTRMAQEVREKMDLLRQRAAEPEPARVG